MSMSNEHNKDFKQRMLHSLREDAPEQRPADDAWLVPHGYFETAFEQWEGTSWETPSGYWESNEMPHLPSSSARVIRYRWIGIAAAAVVLVGAVTWYAWHKRDKYEPSFAELVEQYPPEFDDLLEMDEEYITDVYVHVMADADTVIADTLIHQMDAPAIEPGVALDPKTGLPVDRTRGKEVRWEDITEEDIMEYLEKNEKEELIIE